VVAPDALTGGIRGMHDFLTVAAAAPLQEAGAVALAMPEEFYTRTAEEYRERRDLMMKILDETGFRAEPPQGAYYVMADCSHLGLGDDVAVAKHLVEKVGVAVVPGSSFFSNPADGAHLVRFAFPKKLETLEAAGERLRTLA
jgi:aminotransferase